MNSSNEFQIKDIDRSKPMGRAVGNYSDKQYGIGMVHGLFVGFILSYIIVKFTTQKD